MDGRQDGVVGFVVVESDFGSIDPAVSWRISDFQVSGCIFFVSSLVFLNATQCSKKTIALRFSKFLVGKCIESKHIRIGFPMRLLLNMLLEFSLKNIIRVTKDTP